MLEPGPPPHPSHPHPASHAPARLPASAGKPLPRGLHLEHCTLPELREALQEWGLPWAKGKKEELVQRLLDQVLSGPSSGWWVVGAHVNQSSNYI